MKRNTLLAALLLAGSASIYAQGEADAIRMSQRDITGTARSMSMAGAFGALGGDLSALWNNPAGIGVYRSSEFAGTLNLSMTSTNTKWGGSSINNDKTNFIFDNFGYVASFRGAGEFGFNVGVAYNRKASFNRVYTAENPSFGSSLTDFIADQAYGINPSWLDDLRGADKPYDPYLENLPWLSVLGWNAALITPNGQDAQGQQLYRSNFPGNMRPAARLNVRESGRVDEYNFTFGGNYDDLIYFGATLSVTDFAYRLTTGYDEDFHTDGGYYMENSLNTRGTGVNFKVGMIVRPVDFFRFGVAVHTPTYYSMTDKFGALVDSRNIYDGEDKDGKPIYINGRTSTPMGSVGYDMNTPFRFQTSAAFVIGKKGLLSFEYELQDYSSLKLKDDGGNESGENFYIKQNTRSVNTFKVGGEYRVTPQFSLRAGYAYQSSPVKAEVYDGKVTVGTVGTMPNYVLPGKNQYFTAGLGYRFGSLYTDLAYVHKTEDANGFAFAPLYANDGSTVVASEPFSLKTKRSNILLTVGLKF